MADLEPDFDNEDVWKKGKENMSLVVLHQC